MQYTLIPKLMKGKIVQVNDTAVKVDVQGRLGVITVPRRWVYTGNSMETGQVVEFYFSYMQVLDEDGISVNKYALESNM